MRFHSVGNEPSVLNVFRIGGVCCAFSSLGIDVGSGTRSYKQGKFPEWQKNEGW